MHASETAPLAGLRVLEISSFVAAPLGGLTLAQLGAEVMQPAPVLGADTVDVLTTLLGLPAEAAARVAGPREPPEHRDQQPAAARDYLTSESGPISDLEGLSSHQASVLAYWGLGRAGPSAAGDEEAKVLGFGGWNSAGRPRVPIPVGALVSPGL